jgi:hypothetical protein
MQTPRRPGILIIVLAILVSLIGVVSQIVRSNMDASQGVVVMLLWLIAVLIFGLAGFIIAARHR